MIPRKIRNGTWTLANGRKIEPVRERRAVEAMVKFDVVCPTLKLRKKALLLGGQVRLHTEYNLRYTAPAHVSECNDPAAWRWKNTVVPRASFLFWKPGDV